MTRNIRTQFCPGSPSVVSMVDSKDFKILDSVQLSQIIAGRVTIAVHDGKNYLYLVGQTQAYRYEWMARISLLMISGFQMWPGYGGLIYLQKMLAVNAIVTQV